MLPPKRLCHKLKATKFGYGSKLVFGFWCLDTLNDMSIVSIYNIDIDLVKIKSIGGHSHMVEAKGNVILLHCKGMKHMIGVFHILRVTKNLLSMVWPIINRGCYLAIYFCYDWHLELVKCWCLWRGICSCCLHMLELIMFLFFGEKLTFGNYCLEASLVVQCSSVNKSRRGET